jgi:hypothetical protein
MSQPIRVGDQAFVSDRDQEFGAIRALSNNGRDITVYVENSGDFTVPVHAVQKVVAGKVVFDYAKLEVRLQKAIDHAHDAESE